MGKVLPREIFLIFQTISHRLTFTRCRFLLAPFQLKSSQIILTDPTKMSFIKFSNFNS